MGKAPRFNSGESVGWMDFRRPADPQLYIDQKTADKFNRIVDIYNGLSEASVSGGLSAFTGNEIHLHRRRGNVPTFMAKLVTDTSPYSWVEVEPSGAASGWSIVEGGKKGDYNGREYNARNGLQNEYVEMEDWGGEEYRFFYIRDYIGQPDTCTLTLNVCFYDCTAGFYPITGYDVQLVRKDDGLLLDTEPMSPTGCVTLTASSAQIINPTTGLPVNLVIRVPGLSAARGFCLCGTGPGVPAGCVDCDESLPFAYSCGERNLRYDLQPASGYYCCGCSDPIKDCSSITLSDGLGTVTLNRISRDFYYGCAMRTVVTGNIYGTTAYDPCDITTVGAITTPQSVPVGFVASCNGSVSLYIIGRQFGGSGVAGPSQGPGVCNAFWHFAKGLACTDMDAFWNRPGAQVAVACPPPGPFGAIGLPYSSQYSAGIAPTRDCGPPLTFANSVTFPLQTPITCPGNVDRHPLSRIYGTSATFTVTWC